MTWHLHMFLKQDNKMLEIQGPLIVDEVVQVSIGIILYYYCRLGITWQLYWPQWASACDRGCWTGAGRRQATSGLSCVHCSRHTSGPPSCSRNSLEEMLWGSFEHISVMSPISTVHIWMSNGKWARFIGQVAWKDSKRLRGLKQYPDLDGEPHGAQNLPSVHYSEELVLRGGLVE